MTRTKGFDVFIYICILLNTMVIASLRFMMSENTILMVESINNIFVAIFILEALMKIIALKCDYFKDYWNIFDFLVLIVTFANYIQKLM